MLVNEPTSVAHPSEAGVEFQLRRLSWKQLREARSVQESAQRGLLKDFGEEGVKLIKALQSGEVDEAELREAVKSSDSYALSNFDLGTLLLSGIAGWSYDAPVTPETIENLDEATAVWAGQTILDMTRPPTVDDAAGKNS